MQFHFCHCPICKDQLAEYRLDNQIDSIVYGHTIECDICGLVFCYDPLPIDDRHSGLVLVYSVAANGELTCLDGREMEMIKMGIIQKLKDT